MGQVRIADVLQRRLKIDAAEKGRTMTDLLNEIIQVHYRGEKDVKRNSQSR